MAVKRIINHYWAKTTSINKHTVKGCKYKCPNRDTEPDRAALTV